MIFFQTKLFKTIFAWIVINSVFGVIITCVTLSNGAETFVLRLVKTEISFYIVSSLSIFIGYTLLKTLKLRSVILRNCVIIFATQCSAIAGSFMNVIVLGALYPPVMSFDHNFMFIVFIPSLIISLLLTITGLAIENLLEKNMKLEGGLNALFQKQNENLQAQGLSVRYEDSHKYIKFSDIIYISSSERVTVVHTRCGDYELFQPIGETEKRLFHCGFLRIHKQFIVNASFISHLKYYMGGRYTLFLNDDDDSILPVGRKYTKVLKRYLKI
jgi:hypothetical protein